MDLLSSLDPTALCVVLLVLALTLLWAYVSVSGARREQPKLSALYEQTTLRPTAGQSKAGKTKAKSKQVEGSPRPSSQKSAIKSTETVPADPQKPSPKPSQEKGSDASAAKTSGKGKKKRQGTQAAGEEVVAKAKPQVEEGEEGEWQTQLSRGQLKALRQKQKKEKEKAKKEEARKSSSSDSDSKQATTKGEKANGRQKSEKAPAEKNEASKSKEGLVTKKSNGRDRKGRGSANGQNNSEKSQATSAEATKTPVATIEKEEPSKPSEDKAEHTASSPEPTSTTAPVSASVSNVEEALKDAARSSSGSPEEEGTQSARIGEATFTEVVSSRHKKSRQKASHDSPTVTSEASQEQTHEGDSEDHDEGWVVIDENSLT